MLHMTLSLTLCTIPGRTGVISFVRSGSVVGFDYKMLIHDKSCLFAQSLLDEAKCFGLRQVLAIRDCKGVNP
jgi:hypothetical protein